MRDETSPPGRRSFCRLALAAALALAALGLTGLPAAAQLRVAEAPGTRAMLQPGDDIVVRGSGDPETDPAAVQAAVSRAAGQGLTVRLLGRFDFGDCGNCVVITGSMTLGGALDPSGEAAPVESLATIIESSARAPIVVNDLGPSDGRIRIERLWLRGGDTMAIGVNQLLGSLVLQDNRITGFGSTATFRFGVGSAEILPTTGDLTGSFVAASNHIDNTDVAFPLGDDNGIAIQGCAFRYIAILNNRLHTRGESVEVEGCQGDTRRILVRGNDILSHAAISTLAPPTSAAGIPEKGGHPVALKVIANTADEVIIEGNDIETRDHPTGACIMSGLLNFDGRTVIRGNRCDMDGQFAAILGGWAGTPGFFPPFYLHHAEITDNRFEGNALFGAVFVDYRFDPPSPGADLHNEAHANLFQDNDWSRFQAGRSTMYFGLSSHDNVVRDTLPGAVEDYGIDNRFE